MYGAGGAGLVEDLFLVTKWAKKEYPDLSVSLRSHIRNPTQPYS